MRFRTAQLVGNEIEYYALVMASLEIPHGLYINGETIITDSLHKHENLLFKGRLGTHLMSPAGTQTSFSCQDSVIRRANQITYVVDSMSLDSVHITRTGGADLFAVYPSEQQLVDFTNDTSIVVTTIDCPSLGEITNFQWYLESAIGIDMTDTSTTDSTNSAVQELVSTPVYPNPFVNRLYLPDAYANKQYDISVYDLSGKLLFREEHIQDYVQLDYLHPGMYVIHTSDNGSTVSTQKVVKQ